MLKFETFTELNDEQDTNMLSIFVTLEVLKFPKEIEVNFVRLFESDELLNNNLEFSGA